METLKSLFNNSDTELKVISEDSIVLSKRKLKLMEISNRRKTAFQKIAWLKEKNPTVYVIRVSEIIKDVKYIYFDKVRFKFVVSPWIKGKPKFIGEFDDLDIAIKNRDEYLEAINHEKV